LLGINISAADTVCPAFRENFTAPDLSVTIFSAPQLKPSTFVGSPAWRGELAVTTANMHIHLIIIACRLAMGEHTRLIC